jgi:transcriptional regulator GlxA family with amidase domain
MSVSDLAIARAGIPLNGPIHSPARLTEPLRAGGWPASMDPRIRYLERLMQRDLHRPLRLAELAAGMRISVSRLSHLFSTQTGVSPGRYRKSIRLRQARDLLEGSSLSVKEVAARVGLDACRLIKEFRKTYGTTPAQHRRIMRLRDSTDATGRQLGRTHAVEPLKEPDAAGVVYE